MEIEARGVAIGKGGGREREKGLEHRRGGEKMPLVFHQEGKNFPQNQKDFALRQQYCNRHVMNG